MLTQARVVVEQDELGDDHYTAQVEIEGRPVEVELFEEPTGSTIWVLADPLSTTAVVVGEQADPSVLLVAAAAVSVVGGSAAATIWLWQRRRYRLVRHGGPVVRGVLIRDRDRLRLGSADDEAGLDLAILPGLESLSSSEPRRALRPGQSPYPVAASELLLRPIGHHRADRVSVEVIGLRSDGHPVMVRVNDEIAVTRSGLRHPDSAGQIVRGLRRRRQAAPAHIP